MIIDIERLRAEWLRFKNVHKVTQTSVSSQLGWAQATLGLYLSGRRKIKSEHAVQLANLFNVEVTALLPGVELPFVRDVQIIATASGNPPLHATKKVQQPPGSIGIFCDIPIFMDGAALAIPVGVTLIVSEHDEPSWDQRWPPMEPKYWVVKSKKRVKLVMSATRPRQRKDEIVYHLHQALFI